MVNKVIRTLIVKVMDVFAGSEKHKFSLWRCAPVGEREPKSLVTVNKDDQVVMEEENSKYMYFTPQLSVINMLHD